MCVYVIMTSKCLVMCLCTGISFFRVECRRTCVCVCVYVGEQERECDPGADGSPELIYPHCSGGRPVGNPSNCCRGVERGALL